MGPPAPDSPSRGAPQSGGASHSGDASRVWALAFLPALLAALVYLPSLGNGFVNWDDRPMIVDNSNLRFLDLRSLGWMLTNFSAGYWIPLTWLSLALDSWLSPQDPRMFHLTNLVLHAANTGLVFLLCRRVLARVGEGPGGGSSAFPFGNGIGVPLLTALLFGLHPIHVESVAWAVERKDVLCSFFYLMAIYFYLAPGGFSWRRGSKAWACLAALVLALMSKPLAATLPLVFLVLDYWPLGRIPGEFRKCLALKIPFFILSLLDALATVLSPVTVPGQGNAAVFGLKNLVFFLNAFRSPFFYLWKIAVPANLSPLYPFPRQVDGAYFAAGILAFSGFLLLAYLLLKYRERVPFCLAAFLFYSVTLFPVLGFFQVGIQAAADRYAYLPSLGVFFLFAGGLGALLWKRRILFALVGLALVCALGLGTVGQIGVWRDSITLWERVTRLYPDISPVAHSNLGAAYEEVGRLPEALREYDRAEALPPPGAMTHNGKGKVLLEMGRAEEAIDEFKAAMALDPAFSLPHRNLCLAYQDRGWKDEALLEIQTAVGMDPASSGNYNLLGLCLEAMGQITEAEAAFRTALALNPYQPDYLVNLATLCLKSGRPEKAVDWYRKGMALNPRQYLYPLNLGRLYLTERKPDQAIAPLQTAAGLAPNDVETLRSLGEACLAAGQTVLAKQYEEKARSLSVVHPGGPIISRPQRSRRE